MKLKINSELDDFKKDDIIQKFLDKLTVVSEKIKEQDRLFQTERNVYFNFRLKCGFEYLTLDFEYFSPY